MRVRGLRFCLPDEFVCISVNADEVTCIGVCIGVGSVSKADVKGVICDDGVANFEIASEIVGVLKAEVREVVTI